MEDERVEAERIALRGCRLARVGDLDAARQVVKHLRSLVDSRSNIEISVWIFLLEGLIAFFDGLQPDCRDRLQRGLAVARASGCADLARHCAAWLAHVDFNAERFSDAGASLKFCLQSPATTDHDVLARAYLVLADFSMLAERLDLGRRYYELARRSAVEAGDEPTIAAIIFNRAAMSLNLVRIRSALGQSADELLGVVPLEVRSATLFHRAAGHDSLSHLLDLLNARLAFVRELFADAVDLYRAVLSDGKSLALAQGRLVPEMEFCRCLLAVRKESECRSRLSAVEADSWPRVSVDDALLVAADKYELFTGLGDQARAHSAVHDLEVARLAYRDRVEQLSRQVLELEAHFSSCAN